MDKASQIIHPHKLMVFSKVVEIGNITRAAKHLGMTQPAVTNVIRQLENQYDQKLVTHHGKKIMITDTGYVLDKYWKKFENVYDAMNVQLLEHAHGHCGEIKLAMVSTAKYFIPQLMSHFMQTYPKCKFKCQIIARHDLMQGVIDGTYDVGILTNPNRHKDLTEHFLKKNQLIFICNNQNPLATKAKVTFSDIKDNLFVTREKDASITQILYAYFNHYKSKPNVAYEINSTEAIKEAVMTSNFLALVPKISVDRLTLYKNIIHLPIAIPTEYVSNDWYLIYHNHSMLNMISKKFIHYLEKKIK